MTSAPGNTDLAHDTLLRLYEVSTGFLNKSRFAYDGLDAIAEYDRNDALQRRWVFDPTSGQPLVWYEGTGTAATVRRYLSADERGSIVSVSDSAGSSLAINTYDEYGIPEFGALADQRFGYTGQMWIGSAGLWHLNARVYHPGVGRFMQTDPIGYWDSPNLYAYVLNDPVNFVDPLGLAVGQDIFVTGILPIDPNYSFGMGGLFGGMGGLAGGSSEPISGPDIIVTGTRPRPKRKASPVAPSPPSPVWPAPTPAAAPARERQDWCGNRDLNAPEGVWAGACQAHDRCYGTPGVSKGACDRALVRNIIRACQARGVSCVGIAVFYGLAAWFFGDESFEEGQNMYRRRGP